VHIYLLQHLLMETAEKYPDKQAVVINEQSLTYGELEAKSNQLAGALKRLSVRKGDRVGILFSKSIESIIAVFSVLKAGATYVPIDPTAPAERAKYIVSNCEIKCLLTSGEKAKNVLPDLCENSQLKNALIAGNPDEELKQQNRSLELIFWEEVFRVEADNQQLPDITDTYPAYILYTSGSTGTPKGVVISHLNSLQWVDMAAHFFGISPDDILSNHPPLHFDMSVFDIFAAIKCGSTIVLIPEAYSVFPLKMAECIKQNHISIWNSVPTVLSLLAERVKLDTFCFDSLRLVLFAGAILPVKHLRKVMASAPNAKFFNIYGQTEANSSTFYRINGFPKDDTWKIPIGKAFPNFEVFALDAQGRAISSAGEEGELYVRGSTVAMGYWADVDRTSASFVADPLLPLSPMKVYKTGDLVRLDKDENYTFIGRRDHMVKSKGYRIEMDEIEITLYSYSGIKQAAVVALPDEIIGNKIIAYVAAEDADKVNEKELLNHCAKKLPKYMIPEKIVCRRRLPATSSGKIDRNLLKKEAVSDCS